MKLQSKNYSELWLKLPQQQRESIENSYRSGGMLDKLEDYKCMSIEDLGVLIKKNNEIIERGRLKIILNKIYDFSETKSIFNFPIRKMDRYINMNESGKAVIDINLFNFNKKDCFFVKLFSTSVSTYNYNDLENIFMSIKNALVHKPKQLYYTYLMTDDSGYVKIGRAKCVNNREKIFRTGSPTIRTIAILNKDIERILHKKLSDKRVSGEWFRLSNYDIEQVIKEYLFEDKRLQ